MPEGFGDDPGAWPDHLPQDQMGDGYAACIIVAARLWMDEMETALTVVGPSFGVDTVAREAYLRVDRRLGVWGLTAFQYGAAAETVAKCWERGEEFRRWFNLDTQLGDEGERANESGGILNPALLRIGEPGTDGPE
jgi:hypothetical protein